MKSKGLRVKRNDAEKSRLELSKKGVLIKGLKPSKDGDFIIFPVNENYDGEDTIEWDFEENEKKNTYQDIAAVPDGLKGLLPSSFDVIGDVVIIKIPEELEEYREEIGEALLKSVPPARVVAADRGVKGEYRVRELEIIAGESGTETVHTEYGIRLKLDPAKAYFSPRLAGEHRRIAELVNDGETIVDMFAGVGPFSIMIAKLKRARVYAIDLNPAAVDYLEENIGLNKVEGIEAINADARFIVRSLTADRIIMNLPHSAIHFFEDALSSVDDGWIHYYEIIDDEKTDERTDDLIEMGRDAGRELVVEKILKIRNYAPGVGNYVWDLRVRKSY